MLCLSHTVALALVSVAAADPPTLDGHELKPQTELAQKIERAVSENDARSLKGLFDGQAFAARVLKNLSAPESFQKEFKSQAGTLGDLYFAELVKKTSLPGCGVKFLRVRVVGGEPRALFRVLVEGGLNYVDFVLTVPKQGESVRVVDAYVAVSGEFLSQTEAPLLAKGLALMKQTAGDAEAMEAAAKRVEAVARFLSLVRSGKPKDALAAYERLPAEFKRDKVIMLAHVMTTGSLLEEDPSSYERSIAAFVKAFPSDPAAELVSLDWHLLKKKYAEFHKAIDRLEKFVGGDPYLHVIRGNGFRFEGKLKEAKAAIGHAIAAEPDLAPAYMSLASLALAEKDFKEVARLLAVMEARCNLDLSGVATEDEYIEFRKSSEYKMWWGMRKKK